MKTNRIISISILTLASLSSCLYGVNEKTSEIGTINWVCNWTEFENKFSTARLDDSLFVSKLSEFKQMPFPTKVLYFDSDPKELIGISEEHYQIRYVYNPRIADQVLDGLSPQLPEVEKSEYKPVWTLL
jgi:hypothetical protein